MPNSGCNTASLVPPAPSRPPQLTVAREIALDPRNPQRTVKDRDLVASISTCTHTSGVPVGYRHRKDPRLGLHRISTASASLWPPNSPAVMQSVSSAKSRTRARGLSMAPPWPRLWGLLWWGQHLCFRSHRRKFSRVNRPRGSWAWCSLQPSSTSFSVSLSW